MHLTSDKSRQTDSPQYSSEGTFLRSGLIWRKTQERRSSIVSKVTKALEDKYGRPRLDNPHDSLSDLIYILLSNKTSPAMAQQTYRRLRKQFKKWEDVVRSPISRLRNILEPAGLSRKKSLYIHALLRRITADFGTCDLLALKKVGYNTAEDYLVTLPGVSNKVAKCVLMYTLGAPLLPVDGHVHRIASRLGWTRRKRADQCHEELEALVPRARRFAFHVDSIVHGRLVCRPKPLCGQCCIKQYCQFFKERQ